jgi:TPR repeat protein
LANAQCNLGVCYEDGSGVAQDEAEAVRLFRLAADQGNANAQCNLGMCYEDGSCVAKDEAEAVRLYRLAADQGLAIAQSNLGQCYDYGSCVAKDEAGAEAVRLFQQAAEKGDPYGCFNLAGCYATGHGVQQSDEEALRLFRQAVAAAKGAPFSQPNPNDIVLLQLAAAKGDADAQFNLGLWFESGDGVADDATRARQLFRQAAELGHEAARERVPAEAPAVRVHVSHAQERDGAAHVVVVTAPTSAAPAVSAIMRAQGREAACPRSGACASASAGAA